MKSDRKMKKQVWKSNLKGEKYEQREKKNQRWRGDNFLATLVDLYSNQET